MPPELSFKPQPLSLPDCWLSDNEIGPIVGTYDGPSLVGSTITLKFTGGLNTLTGSFVEDFSVDYPNRHIITFPAFTPGVPTTDDNVVKYRLDVIYADSRKVTLHYGTWKIEVLGL